MYNHFVQYYETDKMGVTHNSNYIRWMEEARLVFFKEIGFDYLDFEKQGIVSPVIGMNNIRFRRPTTVGDIVSIQVSIKAYNSIVVTVHYEMKKDDVLVFEGDSEHCFLNKEGRMMHLGEKCFPEFDQKLKELVTNK